MLEIKYYSSTSGKYIMTFDDHDKYIEEIFYCIVLATMTRKNRREREGNKTS
jgi:hypothetical protein